MHSFFSFIQSYLTEWRIVFWITFVLFVVTTILYDMFASGDTQPWNDPHSSDQQNIKSNSTINGKINLADRNI